MHDIAVSRVCIRSAAPARQQRLHVEVMRYDKQYDDNDGGRTLDTIGLLSGRLHYEHLGGDMDGDQDYQI